MKEFKIENVGDTTKIYITTEIGGYEGIQASMLIPEIHAINSEKIDLHFNSMGGDVFQATAIFNALEAHPAYKTAYVDGVAASAASFLIQAADKIIMGKGTQLMIHDAAGVFQGNSAGLDEFKSLLESVSNNIAEFYAARAGGTSKDWRKRMKAETWYTAEEAVAAGLADEISEKVLTPANKTEMLLVLNNCASLKYKGRENAPDPETIIADTQDITNTSPLSEAEFVNAIVKAFEGGK